MTQPPAPSVAEWSRPRFALVLAGVVGLGLAVQVHLSTTITSWTVELERIVALVPLVVAVLAYVRRRPTAPAWEVGLVALWGVLARGFAFVVWFVVGPAFAGKISISAAMLSGADELRLASLLELLGVVAVFGGLYAVAASRRDRQIVSALALLAVPVALLVVYVIV